MNDAEKLRTLADWFDGYDFSSKGFLNHNEVQTDLRRIASIIESDREKIQALTERLEKYEENLLTFIKDMNVRQTNKYGCDIDTVHIPSLIHKIKEVTHDTQH